MKKNWVMLFLAVMFSSVMWTMAAYFIYGGVRQAQTADWPAADEAEVVESRVVSSRGGKSTTRSPLVKYRYRVGEQWHEDERVSFSTGFGDSRGGYAAAVVSAHPAGSKTTVYVDPADQTRAVLFKGLGDRDWQALAFTSAFVVIPAVVWGVFIGSMIRGGRGHVGTVRVFEPAPGVSVYRDLAFGPWALAIGTLAGGTIATVVFILGFVGTGTRDILLACWGGTLALAVMAWFARRHWINRGRCDGVIDLNTGTLSLARGRRREPEVIELARVTNATLRQDSSRSTNKRPHWRVHLVLDGEEKTRPIADIWQKPDARDFENWVRDRIALPAEPALNRKRTKPKKPAKNREAEDW